jgi:opacity protein-like surface antigen
MKNKLMLAVLAATTFVGAASFAADKPVAVEKPAAKPAPVDPYGGTGDLPIAKPEDKQDSPSVPAPEGAIVLFDGKSLDNWCKADLKVSEGGAEPKPATWKLVEGGFMQVAGGNIMTRRTFGGSFHLHVEFRTPYMPNAKGQGRGNSGVYVHGRYEVQVLDSYGIPLEKYQINDCGSIYSVAIAKANACKAPTVWQTYDIDFTSPKFENGKKVAAGRITVIHNGVKIHDNVEITKDNTTSGMGGDPGKPGPIMLQDHGNPVQYRNIWIVQK